MAGCVTKLLLNNNNCVTSAALVEVYGPLSDILCVIYHKCHETQSLSIVLSDQQLLHLQTQGHDHVLV